MRGLGVAVVLMSIPLLLQSGQPSQPAQPAITVAFEHLAFNVADPTAVARWYVDNMGMKIVKAGSAPFVSDAGGHMMFELYHKSEAKILDFKQIDPNSLHVAFEASDVQALRDRLLKAGATVAKDLSKTSDGDVVITLRDPWGIPIQLLKRTKPMLTR